MRGFLALLIIAASALAVAAPASTPPHILLIVADDLGWNDVQWRNTSGVFVSTLLYVFF